MSPDRRAYETTLFRVPAFFCSSAGFVRHELPAHRLEGLLQTHLAPGCCGWTRQLI